MKNVNTVNHILGEFLHKLYSLEFHNFTVLFISHFLTVIGTFAHNSLTFGHNSLIFGLEIVQFEKNS